MSFQNIFKKVVIALSLVCALVVLLRLFSFSTTKEVVKIESNSEYMSKYNVYAIETPKKLSFANEQVPLDRWDVKESLDRELLVNTYWQSQTLLLLKRSNRYFPIIEPILAEMEVPNDFKYLALIESGFIPTIVSPSGAAGIWQFMKLTAKDYKLEINNEIDERYNIEKATYAACRYLKDSYRKYGNWTIVAATYNAGRGHINKQLRIQDAGNYYDLLLGEETARYVFRILALKNILENPKAYGFLYRSGDLYIHIPTRKIKISTGVKSFAVFAKEHGINYKILKFFNPWLRKPYLTNKYKKTYYINLPEKGYCDFTFSAYASTKEISAKKKTVK